MYKGLIICFFIVLPCSVFALENGFDIAASYDVMGKTVVIRWKNNETCTQQFILQKTNDNEGWINVDTLYNAGEFDKQQIEWEDRNPLPGGYFYRLKAVVDDYNFSFSKPVYVNISPPLYEWSADPITSTGKLTFRYTGNGIINGVVNIILQAKFGRVLYRSRVSSSTTLVDIPTDNLGAGVYYVNMFVEGELICRYRFCK